MTTEVSRVRPKTTALLLVPLVLGGAVALALGVYGRVHGATGVGVGLAGFSSGPAAKSFLATVAMLLAVVQLGSAMIMYGKLKVTPPSWIGTLHRWSGRAAFLAAVPVAVHCLYALGFEYGSTRVLLHSIGGCLFFGAFTTKMLALRHDNLPGWVLGVIGAGVFTLLTVVWLTAAVWFYAQPGSPF